MPATLGLHSRCRQQQEVEDISEIGNQHSIACRVQKSTLWRTPQAERGRMSRKGRRASRSPHSFFRASVCWNHRASRSLRQNERARWCYGFEVAGAAAPLSGAVGFVKSASGKFTFSSILSITSFCVRSVAELPESISNANFNPLTSR